MALPRSAHAAIETLAPNVRVLRQSWLYVAILCPVRTRSSMTSAVSLVGGITASKDSTGILPGTMYRCYESFHVFTRIDQAPLSRKAHTRAL